MKNYKRISLLSLLLTGVVIIGNAQDKKTPKQVEGEMRVIIMKDDNGEMTRTEETFSLEEKEKVKKMLKEKGVEMDFDEYMYKFNVDDELEEGNIEKKIVVRVLDEEGNEKTIDKKVSVMKFHTDSDETFEFKGDFDIKVEEIEGEEGKKHIKIITTGEGLEGEEIIVRTDVDSEYSSGAMVFVRKKSGVSVADLPTSINQNFDEQSSIDALKLFPNPSNGNFNMSFTSKKPQDFELTITDAKGSEVYQKNLLNFEGSFNEDFDLSDQKAGLYFFNLTSDEEKISKKIIVK